MLVRLLFCSSVRSFIISFVCHFVRSLDRLSTHSSVRPSARLFLRLLPFLRSSVPSLVRSFFVCLFIGLLVCSSVHSFVRCVFGCLFFRHVVQSIWTAKHYIQDLSGCICTQFIVSMNNASGVCSVSFLQRLSSTAPYPTLSLKRSSGFFQSINW